VSSVKVTYINNNIGEVQQTHSQMSWFCWLLFIMDGKKKYGIPFNSNK